MVVFLRVDEEKKKNLRAEEGFKACVRRFPR